LLVGRSEIKKAQIGMFQPLIQKLLKRKA